MKTTLTENDLQIIKVCLKLAKNVIPNDTCEFINFVLDAEYTNEEMKEAVNCVYGKIKKMIRDNYE